MCILCSWWIQCLLFHIYCHFVAQLFQIFFSSSLFITSCCWKSGLLSCNRNQLFHKIFENIYSETLLKIEISRHNWELHCAHLHCTRVYYQLMMMSWELFTVDTRWCTAHQARSWVLTREDHGWDTALWDTTDTLPCQYVNIMHTCNAQWVSTHGYKFCSSCHTSY